MTETMTAALQNPTRQDVLDSAVRFIGGLSQRYPATSDAHLVAERSPNPGRYTPTAEELARWDKQDRERERNEVEI